MIAGRRRAVAFFVVFGVCLIALAVALNISWIVLNWREGVLLLIGAILFLVIIAGLVANTIFLVREVRRNEQQNAFINAVTHELKTPVASIRLYLETLQTHEVEEARRREFYRIMLADTDRLLRTIEQVLRAGRTSRAPRPLHRSRVDLVELAMECVGLTQKRHNLPEDSLAWEDQWGRAAYVLGDPDELKAALLNLLDNAVKYSSGAPQISVRLSAGVQVPSGVALSVSDRGVGFPPAERKRIFKRFYRVASRGTVGVKGTGLGLFIVRSIARRHQGRAYATSAGIGKGSTFTMELPLLVPRSENAAGRTPGNGPDRRRFAGTTPPSGTTLPPSA